jgi:hypothetical protein
MSLPLRVLVWAGAAVVSAPFIVLFVLVSLIFPTSIQVAAWALCALVALWLLLRKRAAPVAGSESGLLGRQISKDGLL